MFQVRHVRPEDAIAIQAIIGAPGVLRGTFALPYAAPEQMQRTLSSLPAGVSWLVACADGDVVGSASLRVCTEPRRRHVASLAIAVRDDWQGRGVGTALMTALLDLADTWLNLVRVELQTWVDNAQAIALYQKFGFVREGIHQAYVFRDGQYVDALAMARVRGGATGDLSGVGGTTEPQRHGGTPGAQSDAIAC